MNILFIIIILNKLSDSVTVYVANLLQIKDNHNDLSYKYQLSNYKVITDVTLNNTVTVQTLTDFLVQLYGNFTVTLIT